MLEKIIKLENIGLFAAGTPKAIDFKKATLIYADNARGKSTLSAVLKASATADAAPITARATIGATGPTRVQMRFNLPTGGTNINYDNGKWDSAMPNVVVFDQGFVEQNVYAGSEVLTDHHQALLDFAIGSAAVFKKKEVDTNAEAQVAATRLRTAAEGKLQGYRGAMALPMFLGLPEDKDVDAKIEDFKKRIANAKAEAALTQRAALNRLALPHVDLTAFEKTLPSSFKQVHANAAAIVRAHVEKHGRGTEHWLSEGQQFHTNESCPFCGQSTAGLELVEAYGTFFNQQYNEHMRSVSALREAANRVLPEATVSSWATEFRANQDRAQAWSEQLKLDATSPDLDALRQRASRVQECLLRAAEAKAQAPLEALDVGLLAEAVQERDEVLRVLEEYNKLVNGVNSSITTFKKGLQAENEPMLEKSLARVKAQKVRHSPEVVALVDDRSEHDSDREKFEAAKVKAREELDKLMSALLNQYQGDINKWLVHLGKV